MKAALKTLLGAATLAGAHVLEDDSVLLQDHMAAHQAAASASGSMSRVQLLEKLHSAENQLPGLPQPPAFDCAKYPLFCQAPYNCQTFSQPLETAKWLLQGMASEDGTPNLRSWCMAPQYYPYITTCLAGDLTKAGHIQFQWSLDQHNGVDEMDGSYCFLEGHCSNRAVSNSTTMEEAVKMCDDRYGRKGWTTNFGSAAKLPKVMQDMQDMPKDPYNGFHYKRHTTMFLKAACAMGNYHCDVQYCKETYCKNPYYIKKYGHLLPKAPGHLLESKDWLE